jgi:hypothetical protein
MNKNERQNNTIEFMCGNWHYADHKNVIKIEIPKNRHKIKLNINGIIEEINNAGHWFGDNYFCFDAYYYVRYADENTLIFGKHQSASIGDHEWEYQFKRV